MKTQRTGIFATLKQEKTMPCHPLFASGWQGIWLILYLKRDQREKPYCRTSSLKKFARPLYFHRESNPDQRFRKPTFYPLNYGSPK